MELIEYCVFFGGGGGSVSDNYNFMLWILINYLLIVLYFNCSSLLISWNFIGVAFVRTEYKTSYLIYSQFCSNYFFLFNHKLLKWPLWMFYWKYFCYFDQLYYLNTGVTFCKLLYLSDVYRISIVTVPIS